MARKKVAKVKALPGAELVPVMLPTNTAMTKAKALTVAQRKMADHW